MDIYNEIKKLSKVNFAKVFLQILRQKDIQEFMIELQQDRLFEDGIDSEGETLGEYSNFTVEIKKEKNQRFDHITLRDTGEFYESFSVRVLADGFVLDGKGNKGDKNLFQEYGIDILGFDDGRFEILKERLLTELKFYILNKL